MHSAASGGGLHRDRDVLLELEAVLGVHLFERVEFFLVARYHLIELQASQIARSTTTTDKGQSNTRVGEHEIVVKWKGRKEAMAGVSYLFAIGDSALAWSNVLKNDRTTKRMSQQTTC